MEIAKKYLEEVVIQLTNALDICIPDDEADLKIELDYAQKALDDLNECQSPQGEAKYLKIDHSKTEELSLVYTQLYALTDSIKAADPTLSDVVIKDLYNQAVTLDNSLRFASIDPNWRHKQD